MTPSIDRAGTPSLIALKQWELQRKYESISAEMRAWQKLSEAGAALEKHHRQIRLLASALEGMLGTVEAEVDRLRKTTDQITFFQLLPRAEYAILEVHRVWQYFREKFATRQGPPFNTLLEAIDELVWSCYRPAFAEAPEPPLTFFMGERSPTASSRRETLVAESTQDPNAGRYTLLDDTRLQHLVIPVVGMPWYETAFLPEALLVCHETGHLVAADLGLTDSIGSNLKSAGIDAGRLEHQWLPWSSEVFADLYGVLCLGPAFVGALQMLLARSRNEVLNLVDSANLYPPHQLRVLIALKALNCLGFKAQSEALQTRWQTTYPSATGFAHSACVPDIGAVVKALLRTSLEPVGRPLDEVPDLAWTALDQVEAESMSSRILGSASATPKSTNPRVVLAGAQLVFQQRPALLDGPVDDVGLQSRLVKHIVAGREKGVRSYTEAAARSPANEEESAARERGVRLVASLLESAP